MLLYPYCFAQNYDITWLRDINKNQNSQEVSIMKATSNSTYILAAGVPLTQLIYGCIKRDSITVKNAWQTAAGLGLSMFIAEGLKLTVNRVRPYNAYHDIIADQYDNTSSFPSGHTTAAFATATSLAIEYHKWYVVFPAYGWAATVGYSRLYMGMHYPSDVFAGAALSAGSAWFSYKATEWLQHHKKLKRGIFPWALKK